MDGGVMKVRFIGDVHGKYRQYKRILKTSPYPTIQVGDMGIGFRRLGGPRDGEFFQNPPYDLMKEGKHRFIRGNHDNPGECRKHTQWIPDGTIEGSTMYVGGAISIDRQWRTKEYNWWDDEEVSQINLDLMVSTFIANKPEVMVTHTCPTEIARNISVLEGWEKERSRTEQAFQSMMNNHQPKVWVFGHFHKNYTFTANGTTFICLGELEVIDLEIEDGT